MTSVRDLSGVDTVAFAIPDNIGRLIGKRVPVDRYGEINGAGLKMPDFHLVTGIENAPHAGLAVTGPHTGFPNGVLRPDSATLRLLPWSPREALVICDAYDADGRPAEVAPRWVLRRQVERLDGLGLQARAATELEFYLFRGSYEKAQRLGYRRLVPSYDLSGDNDLLVAGRDEAVIGDIRRLMPQAGIPIEVSQGEGGPGQHEVALAHASPLEMADRHVVYKHAVKEISARAGYAATFMAKVREDQPGSSCHVHISVSAGGGSALARPDGSLTAFGRSFLAGLLAFTPELILLHAPFANSYRRLVKDSWAPSNLTWGYDNRTTCIRILGSARDFRFECRLPGADANPYLALAAVLAAGLEGVERELEPPAPTSGDAYAQEAPQLPADLAEAVAGFRTSKVAARAFGQAVRDHFAILGVKELEAVRRAVTDWDLKRGFERA
jgi:glutamine synthetase